MNTETNSCPICSHKSELRASGGKRLGPYTLRACSNISCQHVFISPSPTAKDLEQIYGTAESSIANSDAWVLAADYERDPNEIRLLYETTRISWLRKNVFGFDKKNISILDVGCSTGMFLRVLKDKGYTHLQGMDISPQSCDFVRRAHGLRCESSLEKFPDAFFDVITCYAIVEHTIDPRGFVEMLQKKLKPTGQLLIAVPNYDSFYRKLSGQAWVWFIPPIHIQYFSPRSLLSCIRHAHLESVALETTYGSTYLYLVLYHISSLFKQKLPSTSRTRTKWTMGLIHSVEWLLKKILLPARLLARMMNQHNEIILLCRPRH